MTIYIVTEITYDYYKFQYNAFVSTSFKKCYDFIKEQKEWKNWDIVTNYDVENTDYDMEGKGHIFIEEWTDIT